MPTDHLLCRYDFEYEDDDDQEGGDVNVENKYYNAKQMKADNPKEAIEEFLGLPTLEEEKGDWLVCFPSTDLHIVDSCNQGLQGP